MSMQKLVGYIIVSSVQYSNGSMYLLVLFYPPIWSGDADADQGLFLL